MAVCYFLARDFDLASSTVDDVEYTNHRSAYVYLLRASIQLEREKLKQSCTTDYLYTQQADVSLRKALECDPNVKRWLYYQLLDCELRFQRGDYSIKKVRRSS